MIVNSEIKIITGRSKESYKTKREYYSCLTRDSSKSINRNPLCWGTVEYQNLDSLMTDIINGYVFCNIYNIPNYSNKIHTRKDELHLKLEVDKLRKKYRNKFYTPTAEEMKEICIKHRIKEPASPFYQRSKSLKGYLKHSYKDSRFLVGTQILWIDIDRCFCENLLDLMECLKNNRILPSLYYTTYSDRSMVDCFGNILHDQRHFRLVYVFDEVLTNGEAETILNKLLRAIKNSVEYTFMIITDPCSKRLTQEFIGCAREDVECCNFNIYYQKSDFLGKNDIIVYTGAGEDIIDLEFDDRLVSFLAKTWKNPCYYLISHDINNRGNKSGERELKKYELIYNASDELAEYITTPEGNLIKKWKENIPNHLPPIPYTVSDGGKRRKRLFWRTLVRKIMCPSATPEDLLYNMYYDMVNYMDYIAKPYEANPISIDWMKDAIGHIYIMSESELLEKYEQYWIDYEKLNGFEETNRLRKDYERLYSCTSKDQSTSRIYKELRYMEYDRFINPKKTIKENLEYLKSNGIEISERTLKTIFKEKGYGRKEWKSLITKGMTFKEAKKVISLNGYDIKDKTLKNYLSKLNNQ